MLNISLPDQIQAFIDEQARTAGFNSTSEYVYHLILQEQERIAQLPDSDRKLAEEVADWEAASDEDWLSVESMLAKEEQ
jgi:antitoxin ParD1/3/4